MTEIPDNFFTEEEPEFLRPYLSSYGMRRLKHVDMNCGMGYTSFPFFQKISPYSRYTHSLHTALCAWHFTEDRLITLACLFHDIATPAFAHTVDFAKGDYLKQESTEEKTKEILQKDPVISAQLAKDGIPLSSVCDYHLYPIADNPSPHLSCDRLEYTIGNALNYGYADLKTLKKIYDDLYRGKNEAGEEELVFETPACAEQFGLLSIACGKVYSSCNDRYGMERLARILAKGMQEGILKEEDLMKDEPYVAALLKESPLSEAWHAFTRLSSLEISEPKSEGALCLQVKKRYIDPYGKGRGRVSSFSHPYQKELKNFLADRQEEWMKGNTI
jgi:HD superfamily phosphohydrolase